MPAGGCDSFAYNHMKRSLLVHLSITSTLLFATQLSFAQPSTLICEDAFTRSFSPIHSSSVAAMETTSFLKKFNLKPRTQRQQFRWSRPNSRANTYDAYTLKVHLGRLSEEQFNALKARYWNLSEVSYSAQRNYELMDFLPPLMQAVDSLQLHPSFVDINWPTPEQIVDDGGVEIQDLIRWSTEKAKAPVLTNCWGTTISILRDMHFKTRELETGWLSRVAVAQRLSDPQSFDEILPGKIRFGDIMLIHKKDDYRGETYVQHAALIIEPGLIFEKTDSGADDAFRLAHQKDSIDKLTSVLGPSTFVTYHRLKPKASIPSIRQTESAANSYSDLYGPYLPPEQLAQMALGIEFTTRFTTELSWITTIRALPDTSTGRYRLDGQNTLRTHFKPPPWL